MKQFIEAIRQFHTNYIPCSECVDREDCELIEEKDGQGCILGEREEGGLSNE